MPQQPLTRSLALPTASLAKGDLRQEVQLQNTGAGTVHPQVVFPGSATGVGSCTP